MDIAPLLIILNAMEIASRKKEMNIEKDTGRYTLWVDQNLKYICTTSSLYKSVCCAQACAPFRLDHTILKNLYLHVKGTRMNCIIYLHVH